MSQYIARSGSNMRLQFGATPTTNDPPLMAGEVNELLAKLFDVSLTRAKLWRLTEPDFPRPLRIGGRRRWRYSDIIAWYESR